MENQQIKTKLENLFFHNNPIKTLICIYNFNNRKNIIFTHKISKVENINHSHVCNIIKNFESIGLIERSNNGVKKNIKLTEKGLKLSNSFAKLIMKMK